MIAIPPVPRPPLRHRATVERNVETGKSPTNQRLPPRFEPLEGELECHYWEPSAAVDRGIPGLREGPNTVLVALGPRMLVKVEADLKIGDHVTEVRGGDEVISAQTMRVVELLWRSTHQEAGLELLSAGSVVEGAGS